MATLVTILQAIYDDLVAIVDAESSVSEPRDHVDLLGRTDDIIYPFLGFEWTRMSQNKGFGGNRQVSKSNYTDGSVDSVDYDHYYELVLDIAVITEGDQPRARDQYVSALVDTFGRYIHEPNALHSDVERVREEQLQPFQGGNDDDAALRHTFNIEYVHSTTDDTVPAADTVNWDVDPGGGNDVFATLITDKTE